MKFHHFTEVKLIKHNALIYFYLGLVNNLINFDLLCFALVGYFFTFPGGWVGGWVGVGQTKIKDHLSPAEAETWAELGNINIF